MNRLAHETSPYLKQHQSNPVDWYPWGEEALRVARETNRPIFLSIGYSACHWCHVMAHECFENPAIAAIMNARFVNIKVDREERPELDKIYQPVAAALTGGGGWPLSVFLTPDQRPFFGGTYFPPDDRYGRPGFPRVLEAMAQAYQEDFASVSENATRLTEAILAADSVIPDKAVEGRGPAGSEDIVRAAQTLYRYMDGVNGGIGTAPKFPNVPALGFLWRAGIACDSSEWKNGVVLSLRKMAHGGIYDQLGGGFHRYSVDATWSVPHFEKMLYDNGLLLRLYSEVLLSGDFVSLTSEDRGLFARVIEETAEYLFREMRSPDGVFYSSQDADTEGQEGRYYVWAPDELRASAELTATELEVFQRHYGVTPAGNFEHGNTVLFVSEPVSEIACNQGLSLDDAQAALRSAKRKLLALRASRTAPERDDKVLISWNALAISGLAWAAGALRNETLMDAARSAFKQMVLALKKRQSGAPNSPSLPNLDDYAFLAQAALDLARWCPEEEIAGYHSQARDWVSRVFSDFEADAGFYFTSSAHEKLLFRPRGLMDAATPGGSAVILAAALVLAEIQGDSGLEQNAERHLTALGPFSLENPYGAAELLSSSLLRTLGPLVVSGPDSALLCRHAHVQRRQPEERQAAIVICRARSCSQPFPGVDLAWSELSGKLRF